MGTYSFADAAIADLEEICDYLALNNPDAAIALCEKIAKNVKQWLNSPIWARIITDWLLH